MKHEFYLEDWRLIMNIIEGIKVLEQSPIKEGDTLMFWTLLGIGSLMALSCLRPMCAENTEKNKKKKVIGKIGYILGLLIMISSSIPMTIMTKETGKYTYKCVLVEDVSAKYISDNFYIISVEDDVWTIRDK